MFGAFLDYIARTNLFNFIIFASIIAYLFVKLDVVGKLDSGIAGVAEKIDNSKAEKEKSENDLKTVEDSVLHLQEEISEIIDKSVINAKVIGEQIVSDAERSADYIKMNALKIVDNKTAILKNDILRRVSLASVEVAKEHIINELANNENLHNKFIDESIEAINEVET